MESISGWNWLDLCSGVGAGFPYAGIKLWGRQPDTFVEWDEWCQSILRQRFPGKERATFIDWNHERFSNIKNLDFGRDYFEKSVNFITASPPCQPFSVDGKRLAATDDRDCFPAILSAIYKLQPQFVIIENVAGLLNCPERPGSDKLYFAGILREISESGYDVEWQCVSSAHFGAPWRRERLVIIAIARSNERGLKQAATWSDQIRQSIEGIRFDSGRGSSQPGIPRSWLPIADRIHEPRGDENSDRTVASPGAAVAVSEALAEDRSQFGVASRDGVNRDRRVALGNALDWRVAAVALKRVEYLSNLTAEHRSADKK